MLTFVIKKSEQIVFAIKSVDRLSSNDLKKLDWLFNNPDEYCTGLLNIPLIGPRCEMITPWSTNAVEITQNMGISGIERIEKFRKDDGIFDPMLETEYECLTQEMFDIPDNDKKIKFIDDIDAYNDAQGLALNEDEKKYLKTVSQKMGRKLTESEVFGFSQVNSEHCRHKIFNAKFVIDDKEQKESLFSMIKSTSKKNPNSIVSAYKDNVAFIDGTEIEVFAPEKAETSSYFQTQTCESVISLKAETHNFPTTVEPFNGAATGTGGEIRDRMAGGKGSIPVAGTAVYMTSLPRVDNKENFSGKPAERDFLYQHPADILIKASNGASDFGNKFGQPLICGSVFTFEHSENLQTTAYDKVIMLAGGIGYALKVDAIKDIPKENETLILLGGDNYRIGMGGGAVSSVNTGQYANAIELNAVQRANPEMQKRVFNVIRALVESHKNPCISIHDHGAGGHLNCFSELLEETGGVVYIDNLPKGDPSLTDMEIIGNESQERMGLLVSDEDVPQIKAIAERERAPIYIAGKTQNSKQLIFSGADGREPFSMKLEYLFGETPKIVVTDKHVKHEYQNPKYNLDNFDTYLHDVLSHEAVACKDWLTNKVDRSVSGRIAMQQTCGTIQLPLNNLGAIALDYKGKSGVATSIGHASTAGLISPESGSRLSIAEALTNIVWAPLKNGIKSVSLSANWMWPSGNEGENARLYDAVKAAAEFSIKLGINIPTGKDSLSMTQKYPNGEKVLAPGTVIISAAAEVSDIRKIVRPVLKTNTNSAILYINFSKSPFELGGSIFYQTLNAVGKTAPDIIDEEHFIRAFTAVQTMINQDLILAGHDISAGGMITSLLEMCFANPEVGLDINLSEIPEEDIPAILFAENPGVIIQVSDAKSAIDILSKANVEFHTIGKVLDERIFKIIKNTQYEYFHINELRDVWFRKSFLMDSKQSNQQSATERLNNYKVQQLKFTFPKKFAHETNEINNNQKIKAAIIREKGVNGDREMAYSLHCAGFSVKDVHVTDLISGREDLSDVNMIVFVGGFSHSDVLGSAKGWAAGLLFNEKAKKSLDDFYKREDTLSLGICNGCQLMVELKVIYPERKTGVPEMKWNNSKKFESAFVNVDIPENNSIMLSSLAGSRLGVWVAHGEGKFSLNDCEENYNIPMKYSFSAYPGNPNGSDYNAAAICSKNGRHLAMMPHIERSIFSWQWAEYPEKFSQYSFTPWIEAFINAKNWIAEHKKS